MKEKREYTIYHHSEFLGLISFIGLGLLIMIPIRDFFKLDVKQADIMGFVFILIISIIYYRDEFLFLGKIYRLSFEKNSIHLRSWYVVFPFYKQNKVVQLDEIDLWYCKRNIGTKGSYDKWVIRLKVGTKLNFKIYQFSSRSNKDFEQALSRFRILVKAPPQ